jgi:hypothetical protein
MKRREITTDLELKQKELLKKSGISLWVDGYDDLYSDFDPRPNSQRAISQDFLDETKRAVRTDIHNKLQLTILMDEKLRDIREEEIISQRLKTHFERHYETQKKERKKIIKKGILFIVSGIILLFAATYLLTNYGDASYFMSFLLVLVEPAGWFFAWEGLNVTIFSSKEHTPDFDFYKQMANCDIKFDSY